MSEGDRGPSEAILSVSAVSKVYRMGEVDVPALRDATIKVYDGEFLIVAGPSGSGKSTLLNMIGGMDRPTTGTVTFLGEDISQASDRRLTVYRREQIGFVFQFFNLIPSLTAAENVEVAAQIAREPLDPMDSLRLVSLEDRADHFPSQLSGGEQQRVAIARALAGNPRLLLCDEPTGALDTDTGRHVLQLLSDLNRRLRKTVALVTHNSAIARMGDRVAAMRDGRIASVTVNEAVTPALEIEW